MRKILDKKGQMSIGNAPAVVLVVGLTFLIMATVALIGEKYQGALPTDSASIVNETFASVDESYVCTTQNTRCNFGSFSVSAVTNASNGSNVIPTTNYTVSSSTGCVKSSGPGVYNDSDWNITGTYVWSGTACNVTGDLQTEIGNNTSIAGIVLTISLVGIVLTLLIGIFLGIRGANERV